MKYQIWDKKEPIITPTNEYFTAEEYIERFCPAAKAPQLKFVVAAPPKVNGSFFNEFGSMKSVYLDSGVQFTDDMTDQECLDTISAWEDEQARLAAEGGAVPSAEERIAAALEFQNLLSV